MRRTTIGLAAIAILVLAGCRSDAADVTTIPTTSMPMTDESMDDMDDHAEDLTFGEPVDASQADRVIEIVAKDDFTFTPASITITAGEAVTFRVTNEGALTHDFTLGDAELQDDHDLEMTEMAGMMMEDEPNAFMIESGKTKEMTWHFDEATELLIGCHIPGHYANGMKATITIES